MTETTERRLHHRRTANLRAWAILDDHGEGLACTVQNISVGGALLRFPSAIALPPQFGLEIPQVSLTVDARVAWSRAEHHGVAFIWPHHTFHR